MKGNFIKNVLLSAFSAICAVTVAIGVAVALPESAPAKAENTVWKTGLFEMEDGVSLKLCETSGMRFIVKMDEDVCNFVKENEDAEMGFVIAPKNLMVAANGDYLNMPKKIGGPINKDKIYQAGEFWCANGCINEMKPANFTRDFVAVSYIQYGGEVRYTEYNDLARNNLYDTVNMATLGGYAKEVFELETYTGSDDPTDDNTGWYGSEEYPIVIETSTEYDALVGAVEGVDMSTYHCVVKNNAQPTSGFSNTACKPMIASEAMEKVKDMIATLPSSVTMPDGIGMIARIRDVEEAFNALTAMEQQDLQTQFEEKYTQLYSLLSSIEGYDRVYKNDATDGTVIPSYVPGGYSSTVGGSATTRTDNVYGNVLTVTSDANGKAALNITNFPNVSKYEKIYFYVRAIGVETAEEPGTNVYWSDGTTNDGWGLNWKNNWSNAFWVNEGTFRLVEMNVSDGYIGEDFSLGFRTKKTGFTFEISDFYGYVGEQSNTMQEAGLNFGTKTDSGESNEYGKVYNISREQWYIDNNNMNTIGTLQQDKLASALPEDYEHLYFWMYNGTGMEYNFHLAGDVSGAWTDSKDSTPLKVGQWTKIVISAEDIALNKNGQWYVYILGGDGQGAAKDGWKISTIYAGPDKVEEYVYTDHADIKETIALINAIPDSVTLNDKDAVELARKSYDKLTANQQSLVSNYGKLTAAEGRVEAMRAANEVVALIDSINPNSVDETLVNNARAAYNALTDTAKGYVTNLAKLQGYEAEIKAQQELMAAVANVENLIANLPDSVTMPDHLVFVTRIENARNAYNSLDEAAKGMVTNYAKLRTLLTAIKGYETVHAQMVEGVNVVPSHVPNYGSTSGGTATMGNDGYYGDYLKVTPNAGGIAAVQFKNFPDVSQYEKLYFNIRVVGASCDIYLSDGITNDGWGDNWNNSWSVSGLWVNNGNWIQKEIDLQGTYVSGETTKYIKDIFASNWALGLRTNTAGVSFEITNIIGVKPDLGDETGVSFGNFTNSGTKNLYGTVYNLTQGWTSNTSLGTIAQSALSNALGEGHDALRFYIYNPNESDVDCWLTETGAWSKYGDLATLQAKAWTEVVIGYQYIDANKQQQFVVDVTSGAGTAGWQISPVYSFLSSDAIGKVQALIDALNTTNPDEAAVTAIREEYEALTESEKMCLDVSKLTACEEKLYGDCENQEFIANSATKYKLYVASNSAIQEAASYANGYLESATGVALPVETVKPSAIEKYRYAIVFGHDDLWEQLDLTLPTEAEIGSAGYAIQKVGRTVMIFAYSKDGYRMAALEFLRETIGYDMISEDCVIYDGSKAKTLPAFDSVTKPSFAYRQKQTAMSETELYGMGLQSNADIWIASVEGWDMHNTLHYLPTATYRSAHPAWYYDYKDSVNVARTQICPTAGGSSSEFNAMVEAIAANLLVRINMFPEKENICFSIMDTGDNDDCQCTRCKLYDTLYGEGGFAAAWIDLMNAVNAKVRESLPANRTLHIAFLAYRATEKAPASIDGNGNVTLMKRYEINENGSYTKTNEDLKCDEGVTVWLAPINGVFAENFNHSSNTATLATIKKWTAISDSVYLWMYGTNFKFYMYPYNTWKASAENYKILADLGVKAAWSQSNETEATAFSDLKGYIDSKFMFNVNADYDKVLKSYFTNYFGAGATQMRDMFDEIVAKCEEIETNYDGLGRGIYDEIENKSGFWGIGTKTYWSKDWLDELVALCDSAKAAVDADNSLTEAQKTAIKNRITKESLFPRYVLYTTFANDYSSSNRKTLRQAFKADADMLGFTLYREADGELSDLYSDWGI